MTLPIASLVRRAVLWPALLLPLLLAAHALAAPYPNVGGVPRDAARADWYQQCMRVRAVRPPGRDLPARATGGQCNAGELYYGTLGRETASGEDWKNVRDCAFRTRDYGVLMMLYANGQGVSRDLALATRYACSAESSTGELKGRLARLRRGEPLDQCDDINGGPMLGHCTAVRERKQDKQRAAQLAALARTWTAKEQLGLEILSKAALHFAEHRRDHETDRSGGHRGAAQASEARLAELERFAADIADFENGAVPQFSEAEFKVLEEKMNDTYHLFMRTPAGPNSYLGTIRRSGVEKTQRAWLAYRDAMELFASIRYRSVPAAGIRAVLTSRRLQQLSELHNAAVGN